MLAAPADYRRSSHRANALAVAGPVVWPHEAYLGLDKDTQAPRAAYRRLFRGHFGEHYTAETRDCPPTGAPLGNDPFREAI